ncbi:MULTISPECIES: bifunctional glutamate N-acetyltransferase/amino-acid acetyltransferase ArgJ [unclassified Bradyrhizobium]|uniref:bifunctional glutamate N-acetyltransferase/amino-acid acetyltransferase ArgJ n=1 Tax=unclassified Bradyrhizobium TaxID=2631580 RepID=UPI001BA87352|nr:MULTISPECIES: bifunctional glutamate N-acetyltransferase/amino-acid acetyltransferase ArgJ [unclassified Bradyrhizobium]MBR1204986.1 bifunctional glutamate N-acetyltransferase/amino-acid acetyltransferase ArgJ [Bradyrhizobium sp. AUGA SZCCT0124]MBR1312072.1 bifunctional glutamate N-acetyltransferase/amino-acid acetyltransferase ArgJ [Bradyrhizobium sp. AUGA SZCCT0051]MBR1343802.1 bifunctional glutamate N-acetyltransferase/amino-acid acetyltransferase ArgJ [Bradyrhizobium sp. AUGA SZCCT0105]M
MSTAVSPLAPPDVPEMPVIAGVRLATAAAGIRYKGRTDVLLALMDKGTTVAGVFTKSKCPSAPVEWCRAKLKGGAARALVVNSGNANAFTGKTGKASTALTAQIAAKAVGCSTSDVFLASTGVIGEPLDATKFDGVLAQLAETAIPDLWMDAAKAIMTTDTFPKVATATVKLGKAKVTINGMAKGAGMIMPDMATMLSFVFTDAPLSASVLQSLLKAGVEDTFNALTIDGDTSTSDTLLAFATGAAAANGAPKISRASDPRLKAFTKAFQQILANLSEQVARDGEGARKLVEVVVEGATTKPSARRIAMSIANSPLVKTAIAGEDANWGRVVMAVGKAGEPANRDKLSISFNGIRVAKSGARDPSYNEKEVSEAMKAPKIQIKVALGLGKARDRVLTCDLTKEYVAINGDYRS